MPRRNFELISESIHASGPHRKLSHNYLKLSKMIGIEKRLCALFAGP